MDLEEQERHFVTLCQQLYDIAHDAAEAKITLMKAYLALHHPGVPCEIAIMENNALSLDVVFPGAGKSASQQLAQELSDYLQRLLL